METVPNIISTKDLSYLSDMFNWNFTAFKQLTKYEQEVTNPEIKELFLGLANMHYQHLEWILSILKKENFDEGVEIDE